MSAAVTCAECTKVFAGLRTAVGEELEVNAASKFFVVVDGKLQEDNRLALRAYGRRTRACCGCNATTAGALAFVLRGLVLFEWKS